MKSAQDGWKAQRAELERNRDKLKQSLADLGFPDPSRVRDEDADGLATSLVETLEELEHALGKISAGTYGRCEQCKKPVAPERLAAMPAARFCLACATRSEADDDDVTGEHEVDGATELGIPAFVADGDEEEHTVQTKVPEHLEEGGMKVWVDNELCSGTGQCVQLCPEVFTIVDGTVRVKEGDRVIAAGPDGLASVPSEHEQAVIAAADGCPSACIFIEVG